MTGYDMDREVTVIVMDKATNKVRFVIDQVMESEAENIRDNMAYQYKGECRVYIDVS